MGIPFYFSYIVKNHPSIIKKLCDDHLSSIKINNLFLDCNSIIYDIVHTLNFSELTDTVASSIIHNVILKIEYYIELVNPDKLVYIAFDGVAPLAKLQQQRERRYKSWYQNQMTRNIFKKTAVDPFNTTAITPGTKFMETLSTRIEYEFKHKERKLFILMYVNMKTNEIQQSIEFNEILKKYTSNYKLLIIT
jgi:5'-3' exoribonuclease 1